MFDHIRSKNNRDPMNFFTLFMHSKIVIGLILAITIWSEQIRGDFWKRNKPKSSLVSKENIICSYK